MAKRKAFTLVELLVVVGIISLMIALLLPALKKARDAANKLSCSSNLRQMALATRMYLDDNHLAFYRNFTGQSNVYGYNLHFSQGTTTAGVVVYDFFHYYAQYLHGTSQKADTGTPSIQ